MIKTEEEAFTKRIVSKDSSIRKLTSKYLDLVTKFNSLTRNEMAEILEEILNELDLIEISTIKTENIQKIKIKEKQLFIDKQKKLMKIIDYTKKTISNSNDELNKIKEHKNFMIKCEEIAKDINNYDVPNELNEKIMLIKNDKNKIIKNQTFYNS